MAAWPPAEMSNETTRHPFRRVCIPSGHVSSRHKDVCGLWIARQTYPPIKAEINHRYCAAFALERDLAKFRGKETPFKQAVM